MMAVKMHSQPRGAAIEEDVPDVLVHALAQLRNCRDSMDTLILIEEHLPERLLPSLAWVASRKTFIPSVAVKTLVKYCGPLHLERGLGRSRARELQARVVC